MKENILDKCNAKHIGLSVTPSDSWEEREREDKWVDF